jgi:hypothetical protein
MAILSPLNNNGNNDSGPQNLGRLYQQVRGMARAFRRRRTKATRKGNKIERPRQACIVCAALYDIATVKADAPLVPGMCQTCKQTLAEGYVACVSVGSYAFLRHPELADLAGKIVRMSDDSLAIIKERYAAQGGNTPP